MYTLQIEKLKKLAGADTTPAHIRKELIDILTSPNPPCQPWDIPYNLRPLPWQPNTYPCNPWQTTITWCGTDIRLENAGGIPGNSKC